MCNKYAFVFVVQSTLYLAWYCVRRKVGYLHASQEVEGHQGGPKKDGQAFVNYMLGNIRVWHNASCYEFGSIRDFQSQVFIFVDNDRRAFDIWEDTGNRKRTGVSKLHDGLHFFLTRIWDFHWCVDRKMDTFLPCSLPNSRAACSVRPGKKSMASFGS